MLLQRSPFSRNVWLTASLVVAMAVLFFAYASLESKVDQAYALRFRSVRLADELRLSSDELTRMVRSYVATGDYTYKKRFQDILAVRDGLQPRPLNYQQLYWNEQLERGVHFSTGPAISLLDLMRQAGFTEQEFEKLALAKTNSDGLTHLELAATALIEVPEQQTPDSRAKALAMVFDENYHQAKGRIMRPIADFTAMVEERTQREVQAAQDRASYLRYALTLCGVALLVLLVRTRWALRATLGGPLEEVHAHITRIGQGDLFTPIVLVPGREASVLGRLAQTQASLAHMDSERRRAQAERLESLRESQTLMEAINIYSIVSMTDPAGTITYANDMFSQVSGYSNAELVGQNHRMLNSRTQPAGYWETVWKTIASDHVWRGEVCNRAKDGSLYWVDARAAWCVCIWA